MSIQKRTDDQPSRKFWTFARNVSQEVAEWPSWKRNALVSFSIGNGEATPAKHQKVARRATANARTGRFVSVKEGKGRKRATVVKTIKKKK